MGSVGAEQAAIPCRGDKVVDLPADYRFLLPTLPASDPLKRTVFLHADIGARPYRIEDFKEPLRQLGILKEVAGMGVFQMGHVWTVRLKSTAAKDQLLQPGKFQVKGGWCVPIDPEQREVRLKLHWVPLDVPSDTLKKALGDYGIVREITRGRWHIDGFEDVETTTCVARLALKEGTSLERLPHQLRVSGGAVLVVVPGRAPQCLRCKRSGHIRRDCKAPRCSECRGYGHERQDCVRSYARAAGARNADDETSEHLMDVDEAERAAAPSVPVRLATGLAPSTSSPGAINPSEECEEQRRSKGDSTSKVTTAKKPSAEDSTRVGAPGAAVVSDQPQKDDTVDMEKTDETEQNARDGTTEVTPASALSDDMDNDATTVKRRLADMAAVTDELALRRLKRQWTLVGKKGRYSSRSRSPPGNRESQLSQ
ncbi:hypothetical protein ISCGN_024348 [Ixodes scapularis]